MIKMYIKITIHISLLLILGSVFSISINSIEIYSQDINQTLKNNFSIKTKYSSYCS